MGILMRNDGWKEGWKMMNKRQGMVFGETGTHGCLLYFSGIYPWRLVAANADTAGWRFEAW